MLDNMALRRACVLLVWLVFACGGNGGSGGTDADPTVIDADPNAIDADPNAPDADHTGGPCTPGSTQCTDCIDNDGDGDIDGYDVECTGAADDDEGSFSTGIPGDNMDPKWQDCFFDGNSGSGNDGCHFHTCCLLGSTGGSDCPVDHNFDPATDCPPQTQMCIHVCGALTPPGCDCFGCCTVCDELGCETIVTNPAVAPDCDQDSIHDPVACPHCTLNADCGNPCDPEMCILCPGQDPSDLPPECNMQVCPPGQATCSPTMPCASGFCSNGCCVDIVE